MDGIRIFSQDKLLLLKFGFYCTSFKFQKPVVLDLFDGTLSRLKCLQWESEHLERLPLTYLSCIVNCVYELRVDVL